jgi:hypothetical protein
LTNLLSNAIKFSPPGSSVRIAAEERAAELHIQVRDQGVGIPQDRLTSIFERFHQVDPAESRRKGGTGLGLAISKSIVEQHGGRIWAESAPGQGATFFVVLPLAATRCMRPPRTVRRTCRAVRTDSRSTGAPAPGCTRSGLARRHRQQRLLAVTRLAHAPLG